MTRYDWINNVLNNATIWDTETFGTLKGQSVFSHAFIDPGSSVKEEYFDFSQDTYNKGSKYGRDLFDKLKFNKNGTVNPEYLNSPKLNAGDTFFDFLSSRIKQKRIFILHNPKFDFNVASEEMGLKRTQEIKKLLGQETLSDIKARRLEQLKGNAAKWSPAEYKKQLQYALSINTNPDHGFNPRRMISGTSTTGAVKSGMSDAAFDRFKSILTNKTGKESFIINTQDMAGMLYGMADSRGYASFEGDYFSATKTSFISRLLGNPKQTHNKTDVLHTEDIFRKLGVMLEEVHSGNVSATTSEFLDRASILNREWSRQGLYTSLAEYAGDAYFNKKIYTKTRINSRNPLWTELNQDDVINSAIDLIERDVPKFGPRNNSNVKLSRDQMRTAFERFYKQAEKAGSKDAYYDRILKKVSSDERFLKRMGPAGIPGAAEIDDVEGFFKSARNSQEELIGRRGKGFLLGVAGIAAGATLYAMATNSTKTKQTDVDLSDYERDIAYRDSRSVLPKKLNNPISQFISGDKDTYNTVEGLHPGGGVNAQMIREMTDFGSGYRGPVAPVHHNMSEDYNEANDAYVYESMRASKIGLGETELYKYMTEEQGEFPAYVQASSAAGTILHAKQQAQGYAASLDGGPSYEAERLVLDTKYGISGHIDEITPQGLGDIKTVSGGIFNTVSESGQPKPMHKSQVMFYLGQTGSERGYIRYVDRDNTSREKTFIFDYNAEEYRALLRKVERVRAEVNQDLARGLLNKWNMPKAASFDTLRAEDAKKETAVEFASKVDQYNHMFREEMAYLKTLKRGMPQGGAGRNRIEDANKRRQERQYNRVAGIGLQSFNDRIGHGIM